MRLLSVFALLCGFICSQIACLAPTDTTAVQDRTSTTVDNLVHVDAASVGYQHPLVCGAGRDFPAGEEVTFKDPESGEWVHAVFPEDVTHPKDLQGKFVLQGHYQTIQNRKGYSLKQPPEDYRYFVVSSWKRNG